MDKKAVCVVGADGNRFGERHPFSPNSPNFLDVKVAAADANGSLFVIELSPERMSTWCAEISCGNYISGQFCKSDPRFRAARR